MTETERVYPELINGWVTPGWITPTGIAPPRTHHELGDRVRYHHCACAARLIKTEGIERRSWKAVGPGRSDWFGRDFFSESWVSPTEGISTAGGKNKTVVVWPEEGSGIIIAMIRRGIGESVRGYGSYEDYEPGYFVADEWVWLYAVKAHLSSLDFVLTPIWATWKDEN